jgi:hypothetical protein
MMAIRQLYSGALYHYGMPTSEVDESTAAA